MFHFGMSFPAASPRSRPRFHGRRVSRDEYLQLPDDGFRYDMIDGVLYAVPSADFQHGKRNGRFYRFLDEYLETHPYGEVTQETDILLPDGGDILCPDLCFVLNENTGIIRTHVHGTPDLICEVLSPRTQRRDLGIKADRYLANGVQEYWILAPETRSIEVRYSTLAANGIRNWVLRGGQGSDILESRLLPGFHIENARVWR
jgi:Uma2 family endonuclease